MQDKRKLLWRSAKEVKQYIFLMKLLPVIAGGLAAIIMIVYVITVMYTRYGAFSVLINKFDNVNYLLSLSESPDFENPSERIHADAVKDITNIDGKEDLPNDLDRIDGVYPGKNNFLCYTFYLKNVGEKIVDFEYVLYMVNVTNEVDRAVRVRLYIDGVYTDYARVGSDGNPEPDTAQFESGSNITSGRVHGFEQKEVIKYTVVIWLEGNDPECIDDRIGGQFKIDMKFSIINIPEA